MDYKDLLKGILGKWSFPILEENETTIVFRFQLNYIQATLNANDEMQSLMLSIINIFKADNEKEMLLGLKTCNELNYSLVMAKLYIDPEADLIISCEFFFNDEDLEYILPLALKALVTAKKKFCQRYEQVEEEAKLIDEINKQ